MKKESPVSAELKPYINTDRELWREKEGDYYAPSIHVTESGSIGIDVGGSVFVKPVRVWHELAKKDVATATSGAPDFDDEPDAYLYKTGGPWDIAMTRQECAYGGVQAARIVPVWFVSKEWKLLNAASGVKVLGEWIRVKDGFPTSGETVLTYADSGLIQIRKFGKFTFPTHTHVVTHWMPLPASPSAQPVVKESFTTDMSTPATCEQDVSTDRGNAYTSDAYIQLLRQARSELSHYESCPQGQIPETGDCECFAGELMKRIDAALADQLEPHPPSRHCMCADCVPSFDVDQRGMKAEQEFGFVIDPPTTRIRCVRWPNGGVSPANEVEMALWDKLHAALPAKADNIPDVAIQNGGKV